jgi:hypothetical protein
MIKILEASLLACGVKVNANGGDFGKSSVQLFLEFLGSDPLIKKQIAPAGWTSFRIGFIITTEMAHQSMFALVVNQKNGAVLTADFKTAIITMY